MNAVANFLIFQVEWWLCVLHSKPYFKYGFLLALVLFFIALSFNHQKKITIYCVGVMASIGLINDMLLRKAGILVFSGLGWLAVLWLCFGGWFYHAKALHKKYFLMPLFFMVLGPLSYFAGSHFDALQIAALNSVSRGIFFLDWFFLGVIFMLVVKAPNFSKTPLCQDHDRENP